MGREIALQQERACAALSGVASSISLTSAGRQRKWGSFLQRFVLLFLVQSLLVGAVHAVPIAVVEPAITSTHSTAVVGLSAGNPILPATGEKFQSETDFTDSGAAPLSFGRFYRSIWGADASRVGGTLGRAWVHSHGASLHASPGSNPTAVTITSAEGYARTFMLPAGASSWSAIDSADSLTRTLDGWIYRRAEDDSTSRFDAAGTLLSHTARDGWTTRYSYNLAGQLATITNAFGRTLNLAYNSAGLLSTVTTPDGRSIGYAYLCKCQLTGGNPVALAERIQGTT